MLRRTTPLLLAAIFCLPLLTTGCAEHRTYYDPYYHDQHPWVQENSYYTQWETDTHRSHEDFNKRDKDDQKAYWDYRHKNDKGHDKDRDNHDKDHDQNPH
jgi:hypothetical protein